MNHKRTENLEAEPAPIRHTLESQVVVHLPKEIAYPLQRVEFDILCEGERASIELRMRDLSIEISMAALFAFVGLIVGIHGEFAIAAGNWVVFAFGVLTLSILWAGLATAYIVNKIALRHKNASAYSHLKEKIEDWFRSQGQP
jgi:hypothetical protein